LQSANQYQVLVPGEGFIESGILTRQSDQPSDRCSIRRHVVAADVRVAGVWSEERGEDADSGRLSCAVRTQKPEDDPFWNLKVESCEGNCLSEPLGEILGEYCLSHCSTSSAVENPGVTVLMVTSRLMVSMIQIMPSIEASAVEADVVNLE